MSVEPVAGPGVRVEPLEGGAMWHVVLATPTANILDGAKVAALTAAFDRARDARGLKVVLLDADGDHFSFGASVEEHLPDACGRMIPAFHRMFLAMLDASVPTLAAVRGRCLGGALELISPCQRVFAAPDALLGQPEIALGVFAPVASVVLHGRIGRARAEDLCVSGRIVDAAEALRIGLVDHVAADPRAAALDYARAHLLPRSAAGLRLAVRAARAGWAERFRSALSDVERLYLHDLMATHDATEGLRAFLEKRRPDWRDQ